MEEKSLVKKLVGIENNIELLNDELNEQNKSVKGIENELNQLESELMKTHLTLSQILENASALKQNLIKTEKLFETEHEIIDFKCECDIPSHVDF